MYTFARYLQSPLSFASASSRYLLHFWSRKCRLKNVQHPLLVLLCSNPLVQYHSIFILYYLFYVHHHEKSSNYFTPVIVIVFISPYHPRIMHKIMYIRTSYLFCIGSSNPFCVIYFMLAWFWGVADLCWHDTYQQVYIHMSVCKHDEIMGRVKTDVWPLFYFDFILIHIGSRWICA